MDIACFKETKFFYNDIQELINGHARFFIMVIKSNTTDYVEDQRVAENLFREKGIRRYEFLGNYYNGETIILSDLIGVFVVPIMLELEMHDLLNISKSINQDSSVIMHWDGSFFIYDKNTISTKKVISQDDVEKCLRDNNNYGYRIDYGRWYTGMNGCMRYVSSGCGMLNQKEEFLEFENVGSYKVQRLKELNDKDFCYFVQDVLLERFVLEIDFPFDYKSCCEKINNGCIYAEYFKFPKRELNIHVLRDKMNDENIQSVIGSVNNLSGKTRSDYKEIVIRGYDEFGDVEIEREIIF
jgi:hypothetical protein